MKQGIKVKSGSIKIEPSVWEAAKKICEKTGVKLSYYATMAIMKENAAHYNKSKDKIK